MKNRAHIKLVMCTFLYAVTMHAHKVTVINAVSVPVYVGIFSVNGNNIADIATRPVYKLPKSSQNRTIKPYASFEFTNDYGSQKFVFSTKLEELKQVLDNGAIPPNTEFSGIFTYQPEEPNTFFEIQRDRVSRNDETIAQKLVIKPLGTKITLSGPHAKEELNVSSRKEFEKLKRAQARAEQQRAEEELNEEEQVPAVNIVDQRSASRQQVDGDAQSGAVMFHVGAPRRANEQAAPAQPKKKSRWSF